ncbi:MAG: NAD(+) synthase [Acidobacteriota bacterium]
MRLVKVGAAVLNQTPLDWENNRANILKAIESARAEEVSILCLPELCISGYGCEDAFLAPGVLATSWAVLQEILPHTQGMIVSLGLPVRYNNVIFDAAALVADCRILGFSAKRHLAGEGVHYEPRWFNPWPEGEQVDLVVGESEYPLGDLYFDCGGVKIGFEICEDAWVADRPGSHLFSDGVDVIMNPSASHFAFGKQDVRRRFVLEGSRAFGVTYLYSNLLGNEAGRAIYGGGALVASGGKFLGVGRRFSFRDCLLTSAVADLDLTRMSQARNPGLRSNRVTSRSGCVRSPFRFPEIDVELNRPAEKPWEGSPHLKEEEFSRAIALGLFDYLRKSRSQGFVVSLSGGADSSAVACLVGLMVEWGVEELGLETFRAKLNDLPRIADAANVREVVRSLLCCVYQSTQNSSQHTREAARGIAAALGAEFLELDVDPLVQDYVDLVSRATGSQLSWDHDDIALQNIQARVRAPGVWLLANLRGALLLAASNRSEAAVGYATMDGDTCGGLSPIAGIDKAFLRRWLDWLRKEGPHGLAPLSALETVLRQTPTAELRPPQLHQTDEADLMPYDLLDAIERAAIRDKGTPLEVFRLIRPRFPHYSVDQLAGWVERFFLLWCRNQWKRERYAPSFHVDDANLDPKTWCRFPILSGGFRRELAELKEYLKGLRK